MKFYKFLMCTCGALAIVGLIWWLSSNDSGPLPDNEAVESRVFRDAKARREYVRSMRQRNHKTASEANAMKMAAKPVILVEDDEYDELTELQRELLKELQEAVDRGDFKAICTLIERMKSDGMAIAANRGSSDWAANVPIALRRNAVLALGWVGSWALPELVEFLADPAPEVVADAQSQLEQALMDFEMGDYELAKVIVNLMRVVNEPDAVDSYYMELSRMRNSVMISTLVEIASSGTEVAKEKFAENLAFYTGDDAIETVEQAEQWLLDNPDGEDDDEFYGNVQPSDGDDRYDAPVPGWTPPPAG